ncbi:MAG: thermonuclease family protein [Methanobrevibacter sp.]|uniref:thermonuclease family protein n=1 Tax=Methanobrevibacter sp. TaxID=66852 RepID=UPI001B549770|nr:thermonuclease family protein [Methanobrevibacter sp.]MBP3791312.1 thermonuclease family protein [Methanobrevibacter sp.]
MKVTKKHIFSLLVILIIAISAISIASAYTGTGFSHNIPSSKYYDLSASDILSKYNKTDCHVEESAVCTNVVDGDTIYLDNGEKIRFVGVNTPERGVEGYITSKNFVQKLCLNKKVGIDVDNRKHNDKYGRTLGVVIVDGKNVNEMLLKEGLAEIMYMPPSEFYPYDWANGNTHVADTHSSSSSSSHPTSSESTSSSGSASYVGNANTGKFHEPSCSSVKDMAEGNKVFFSARDDAISQGYIPCKRCNP